MLVPVGLLVVLLVGSGVAALIVESHKNPIVAEGGYIGATFCFDSAASVTSGAEYLKNTSSKPVTVTSARAVAATNAQLVDTAVVALTGKDSIGNGDGLPTSATQGAAALVPGDWAKRQFVPTAVIPPASQHKAIMAWQLVFGVKVLHLGERATVQRVVVDFKQGGRRYHITSHLDEVIEASGADSSHC